MKEDDSDDSVKFVASMSSTSSFSTDSLEGGDGGGDSSTGTDINVHCSQQTLAFPTVDYEPETLMSSKKLELENNEDSARATGESTNSFCSCAYSTCSEGDLRTGEKITPSSESNKKAVKKAHSPRMSEFDTDMVHFCKPKKTNRDQVTIIHFRSPLDSLESKRKAKEHTESSSCVGSGSDEPKNQRSPISDVRSSSLRPVRQKRDNKTKNAPPPLQKITTAASRRGAKPPTAPGPKRGNATKGTAVESGDSPSECPAAAILARLYSRPEGTHKSLGVVTHSKTSNLTSTKNRKGGSNNNCPTRGDKKKDSPGLTEIEVFMPKVSISRERVFSGFNNYSSPARKPLSNNIKTEGVSNPALPKPVQRPMETIFDQVRCCGPRKLTVHQINEALTEAIQELQKKVDELLPPVKDQHTESNHVCCSEARDCIRNKPPAPSYKGTTKPKTVQGGGTGDQRHCPLSEKNRTGTVPTTAAVTTNIIKEENRTIPPNAHCKFKPLPCARLDKLEEDDECSVKATVALCADNSENDKMWTKTYREIHLNYRSDRKKKTSNCERDSRSRATPARGTYNGSFPKTTPTQFQDELQHDKKTVECREVVTPKFSQNANSLKALRSNFSYRSPYSRKKLTSERPEERKTTSESKCCVRPGNNAVAISSKKQKPAWRAR